MVGEQLEYSMREYMISSLAEHIHGQSLAFLQENNCMQILFLMQLHPLKQKSHWVAHQHQ